MGVTQNDPSPREAEVVPQLSGQQRPSGSVLYICSGTNEHGKQCGKLLLVWVPPVQNGSKSDHGRAEVKCRRCKTLNYAPLDVDTV